MLLHNDAAEMNILGTAMQMETFCMENILQQEVKAEMFYQPTNKAVFQMLEAMLMEGKEINFASATAAYLDTEEGKADPKYTFALLDYAMLGQLDDSIVRLKEHYMRRRIWEICSRGAEVGVDNSIGVDEARESMLEQLKAVEEGMKTDVGTIKDAMRSLYELMNENAEGDGQRGIPTGFEGIDSHGYFQYGDLVVIAAESSQGKTSFAVDIATNVAKAGIPVAIYSMEMTQRQIAARMMAADTNINSHRLLAEKLSDEDAAKTNKSLGILSELPMYFDDKSTISVDKIYQSIRMLARKNGVKMAVVDYLQILSTNQKVLNIETFYGEVARRLKNLAKELGICIVLLSQLSRDPNTTEPNLRRIRGSGQINEAADWTFTIYRPEVYGKTYTGDYTSTPTHGTALIKCEKGRNVGTFDFICGFNPECTHFSNDWETAAAKAAEKQTQKPQQTTSNACPF